jgi:hypothetical protein
MEDDLKKPTGGKRTSVVRPTKKTVPAPLPPEASARVSAAAAAAGAVKPAPAAAAPAKPAPPTPAPKPASAVMARPVPPAPKIAPPTVVPVPARKVEMSFDAPFAKFVNIAGDFNAWEMTTLALRKTDSLWKIMLELKPGTYQYKFLVDGEWVNDPNNVRTTPNQFGSLNNVLEVN